MNRLLFTMLAALAPLGACGTAPSALNGGTLDGGGGAASVSSASVSSASVSSASAGGASANSTGSGGGLGVLDCAPCPAGDCAVTTIASGKEAALATGIAVTGEGLYWTSRAGNTVMRLAASGGPPEVLAEAANAPGPRVVAVSGGSVAWVAQGVYACSVASCAATTALVRTAATGEMFGVADDGQDVYFTASLGTPGSDSVLRCPPTANGPCTFLGKGLAGPNGIVVQGSFAFWTEQGNGNQDGYVDMSPKSGGGLTHIASALQLPSAVAADDVYAYWTEADPAAGKVRRCPYTTGPCQTPQDLATGLAAPTDLALTSARVYWIDEGDGRVLSCPVGGCAGGAPRVHASGRTGLQHIAVGQSCVFWTDDVGGGSVSKAAL